MVEILRPLLQALPPASVNTTPARVFLSSPLPPSVATELKNAALTVQVVQSATNGLSTLQLPNGQTVQATLNPPLPSGTQLNLLPTGTPTSSLVLLARTTAPAPQQPASAPLPLPAQNVILNNLVPGTGNPAQATPLPAGPVLITLPPGTNLANLPTLITATVASTATSLPGGSQTVTLNVPGNPTATVQTGTTLPTGTTLTLAPLPATASGPSATALVVTAPTVPAPAAQPQTVVNLPVPQPAALAVAVPPNLIVPFGAIQTARVVGAPTTTLQEGLELPTPLQVAATTAINPTGADTQGRGQQQGQFQNLLLAGGQPAAVRVPTGSALPPGSTLILQATTTGMSVLGVQPATTGVPAAAPTMPPLVLTGTVTAHQAGNPAPGAQQVLTLATAGFQGQTVTISTPEPLPLGTTLTFSVPAPAPAQSTVPLNATATLIGLHVPEAQTVSSTITSLARTWPLLTQALHTLGMVDPALARQAETALPQTRAMLPGLLTFADATLTNQPEAIVGREATLILKALGIDLAGDIAQLHSLTQAHAAQGQQAQEGWRGFLFPYVETPGEQPKQGGFFWRRGESEQDERESSNTRFVVQMELSRIGDVQLDGLHTGSDLWLKLRLKNQPDSAFTPGLQHLVHATLAQFGLKGGIAVETVGSFETNPLADMLAHAPASYATAL